MTRFIKNKYFLGILIIIGLGYFLLNIARISNLSRYQPEITSKVPVTPLLTQPEENKINTGIVIINDLIIPVELRKTEAEVEKGLSGRLSLDTEKGMLFFFDKPAIYQFWMPDMYFPIDIIWINNNEIVDISANVSNEFDPVSPRFYRPKKPAQYVLEVNANFAKDHKITVGMPVIFEDMK